MPRSREIYLLDPQVHSPETIAVAFAKTSRSPESFQKIASELTGESSASFNEKWVVGYGHSSVAEHAVLHIAVENVSRLAVECLESNRLASYTEKSTRYQKWNRDDFHIPEELTDLSIRNLYIATCQMLFSLYDKFLPVVFDSIAKDYKDVPGETPARKERIILTAAGDVCRFLLPVSAFANVGVTINARALEHAITKMLSHPLLEVQAMGRDIKAVSQKTLPTLLKYANPESTVNNLSKYFSSKKYQLETKPNSTKPGARLIGTDQHIESSILQATLIRFAGCDYTQSQTIISQLDDSEKRDMFDALLGNLPEHEIPIRELEFGNFKFEVILDQGAYLELKRHRMMTQTPAPFSPCYGYTIPKQIEKAGLLSDYKEAMEKVKETHEKISSISSTTAAYILPNAFNRLVIFETNFRSLYHFINLRSAPNAHFSMRRIAHQMADQVKATYPVLGSFLRINQNESATKIEEEYFHQV